MLIWASWRVCLGLWVAFSLGSSCCLRRFLVFQAHITSLIRNTHTHVYIYICMYLYICIYIYIYTYVYTYNMHDLQSPPNHAKSPGSHTGYRLGTRVCKICGPCAWESLRAALVAPQGPATAVSLHAAEL